MTHLPIMSISWGREQQGCSVTNLQGTRSFSQTSAVNIVGSFRFPPPLSRFSVSFSVSETSTQSLLTGGLGVVVVVVVVVVAVEVVPEIKHFTLQQFQRYNVTISSPVVTTSCRDD